MKSSNLLLALFSLYTSAASAAAPTPGQGFYLKVVGGNTLLNGAVLRDNNTYDLGIIPPPYYGNGAYGDHPSPISVNTQNTNELLVSPTIPHPGPISGRPALVSDGTGDWMLSKVFPQSGKARNVGPNRDGVTVKVVGWEFKDAIWGGATVLRWTDATSPDKEPEVVVKRRKGEEDVMWRLDLGV